MPDITSSVEEVYVDIIQGPSQIIYPDTAKLQSNHRLYNSDIYKNLTLTTATQTTRLQHSPGPNSRQNIKRNYRQI